MRDSTRGFLKLSTKFFPDKSKDFVIVTSLYGPNNNEPYSNFRHCETESVSLSLRVPFVVVPLHHHNGIVLRSPYNGSVPPQWVSTAPNPHNSFRQLGNYAGKCLANLNSWKYDLCL